MKLHSIIIASLLFTITAEAQTINVHKTDGTVITYPSSEVKYIDFTAKGDMPEPPSYITCPDANHPHMIDLGLPSGTKWACCNVGASAPEQYGNYYAWGETLSKSVYNELTYLYFTGRDVNGDGVYDLDFSVLVEIGSDIAGTVYDVATTNWRAPWKMPSLAQCQELLNKCTSEWTTQNNVRGTKFTGPNGGSIFLPAACNSSNPTGGGCQYWSSALYESNTRYAWLIYNYPHGAGVRISYDWRYGGKSVRPVRSN